MPAGIGVWNADVGHDNTDAEKAAAYRDAMLAKKIGERLELDYPGHYFLTEVMRDQGVAVIRHPLLPAKMGVVIHMKTLASDPALRSVMRAGGEVLERFNIDRGRYNRDNYRAVAEAKQSVRFGTKRIVDFSTGNVRDVVPSELVLV